MVYEGQLLQGRGLKRQSSKYIWNGNWKRFGTAGLGTEDAKINDVVLRPQISQHVLL